MGTHIWCNNWTSSIFVAPDDMLCSTCNPPLPPLPPHSESEVAKHFNGKMARDASNQRQTHAYDPSNKVPAGGPEAFKYSAEMIELIGPNYNEGFGPWALKGITAGLEDGAIVGRWQRLEQATRREPIDEKFLFDQVESAKQQIRDSQAATAQVVEQRQQPPRTESCQQQNRPTSPDLVPDKDEKIQDFIPRAIQAGVCEPRIRHRWTESLMQMNKLPLTNASWGKYYGNALRTLGLSLREQPPQRTPLVPGTYEPIENYCLRAIIAERPDQEIRTEWARFHARYPGHPLYIPDDAWGRHLEWARAEAQRFRERSAKAVGEMPLPPM